MKAKIERIVKLNGDCFFYVYANDELVKCLVFKLDETEDSIFSESKNLQEAMALVKKIEASKDDEFKETIYETPEPSDESLHSKEESKYEFKNDRNNLETSHY